MQLNAGHPNPEHLPVTVLLTVVAPCVREK